MCYVGENLIDVAKIECGGILTVWSQVLDCHTKEPGNGSRE
jgi:hypothetical protein